MTQEKVSGTLPSAADFHERWSNGHQVTQSASGQNTQPDPEDGGDEPGGRSDLAGHGCFAEGLAISGKKKQRKTPR